MSHRLRPLVVPFLVKPPTAVRVRTRLQVSDLEARLLWALGLYLGGLANHDWPCAAPRALVAGMVAESVSGR